METLTTKDVVAILPARGGSKRIPRKNIRHFIDKPAIGWPISAAAASGLFTRIVVTTDDIEIAKVAESLGAEAPFRRDAILADDYTGTTEVIRDAVDRLGLAPDVAVCCIYPTALLITASDIIEGYSLLSEGANWVVSVGEYTTPIDRAYKMEGGKLVPRQPDMMPKRSQDLSPAFFDAGQFYWGRAKCWSDPDARVWDGAAGVVLPAERAVDIDTLDDWARAEQLATLQGL